MFRIVLNCVSILLLFVLVSCDDDLNVTKATSAQTGASQSPKHKTTDIPLTFEEDFDQTAEAQCRSDLHELTSPLLMLVIASVGILSVAFLAVSIYLFIYIQKHLLREMDEAINKAHDVMDHVMVSLIPNKLVDEIGANEIKPSKKTDKSKNDKTKTDKTD